MEFLSSLETALQDTIWTLEVQILPCRFYKSTMQSDLFIGATGVTTEHAKFTNLLLIMYVIYMKIKIK
jgi:hypothetical protein